MRWWLVFLLLSSQVAWAYVPPSEFLVKSMIAKHGGIKGLRIKSVVTAYEEGKPESTHFKLHMVFDPKLQSIRCWALNDQDQPLFTIERKENEYPLAARLLLSTQAPGVVKVLKDEKIPIKTEEELFILPDENERRSAEISSFRRWKNTMAWVIGNNSTLKDSGLPQLWIEKDSFLPLRIVTQREIHYEGFRFMYGYPWPQTISLMESVGKEHPALREELSEMHVATMAAEFKHPIKPGFTDAGNAISGSLKRLIETYFQLIR